MHSKPIQRIYGIEKYSRYNSESFNADSMKFNSNDSYQTLKKERMSMEVEELSQTILSPLTLLALVYILMVIRKGIFNQFALSWVNEIENL